MSSSPARLNERLSTDTAKEHAAAMGRNDAPGWYVVRYVDPTDFALERIRPAELTTGRIQGEHPGRVTISLDFTVAGLDQFTVDLDISHDPVAALVLHSSPAWMRRGPDADRRMHQNILERAVIADLATPQRVRALTAHLDRLAAVREGRRRYRDPDLTRAARLVACVAHKATPVQQAAAHAAAHGCTGPTQHLVDAVIAATSDTTAAAATNASAPAESTGTP